MGLTNNNPLLTGVRGRIGNLLIKQTKYGTVITLMPDGVKRKPTRRQQQHRDIFAAAIKYAKAMKLEYIVKHGNAGRPESQEIYLAAIKDYVAAAREARFLGPFSMKKDTKKPAQEKILEKIKEKAVGKTKFGKRAK